MAQRFQWAHLQLRATPVHEAVGAEAVFLAQPAGSGAGGWAMEAVCAQQIGTRLAECYQQTQD
jgi:hypothetical protein